jgi:CRP-like cAMP-binding protein
MSGRPLSIVAAALEGRAPALRSLVEGQVLCREGDPPGPLYVICSGSVRAYRRSLTEPEMTQDLAHLGPGEIVGEMAPMLQQPRSATVQAIEASQVLEVPATQVGPLLRRHGSLLRVLTLALKDRAGLSPDQIESVAARLGVKLPQPEPDGEPQGIVVPAPEHDTQNP